MWFAAWISASFLSLLVYVPLIGSLLFSPEARAQGVAPAAVLWFWVVVGPLALVTGWVILQYVEGRPPSLKAWLPQAMARGRERTIAFADKVLVASVSSILVFFVLHAMGFSTDFKAMVVPIGFGLAVYLGLSIFA